MFPHNNMDVWIFYWKTRDVFHKMYIISWTWSRQFFSSQVVYSFARRFPNSALFYPYCILRTPWCFKFFWNFFGPVNFGVTFIVFFLVHVHLLGHVNTMKQKINSVTAGTIFLISSFTFTCAYTAPIIANVVKLIQGMKNGSYTMPITNKKANIGLSILITWYTPSVKPASVNSSDNVWASPTRYADDTVVLKIQITMMDTPITSCSMSENVKSITFMFILYTVSTTNSRVNMPHGMFQG